MDSLMDEIINRLRDGVREEEIEKQTDRHRIILILPFRSPVIFNLRHLAQYTR